MKPAEQLGVCKWSWFELSAKEEGRRILRSLLLAFYLLKRIFEALSVIMHEVSCPMRNECEQSPRYKFLIQLLFDD